MAIGRALTDLLQEATKKAPIETPTEITPSTDTVIEEPIAVTPKLGQNTLPGLEPEQAPEIKPSSTFKRSATKGKTPEQIMQDRIQDIKRERQQTGYKYQQVKTQQNNIEGESSITKKQELLNERIKEKKNNIYLKSLSLKQEQVLTKTLADNQQKGVNGLDSILNIISYKIGRGFTYSNIESRQKAVYTRVSAPITELKDELRTKTAGFRQNIELANEVIRFGFDGKTKNPELLQKAGRLYEQWKITADTTKKMLNQAGHRIGNLEDWVMPQSHIAEKIRAVGFEEWKAFIKPKLQIKRIEQEQGSAIDDILQGAYDSITETRIKKGFERQQLAKRGEFERVLHFNGGDNAIAYKDVFGNPDVFATMEAHLRQQSGEIALLQIMGPNPDLMYENLKQLARSDKSIGTMKEEQLDRVWAVASGKADGYNIVDEADNMVALIGGGIRAGVTAAMLGSTVISSINDLASIIAGAGYRNLNSFKIVGRGLGTMLQDLVSIGKFGNNINLASRIGVISEAANASMMNGRFGEVGTGWLQRRAENVLRAGGLSAWTHSLRVGFGLELAANLSENFNTPFNKIPFKPMLEDFGIGEKEWDIIKTTKPRDIKGAKFIDIEAVYEKDEALGYKVSEMINSETDAFVLAPSDRVRAFTTWGSQKGTFAGETSRMLSMFKSFPITITMLHLNRMQTMDKAGKAMYAAKAITTSTILGGTTLMMYDIATGNEPRDTERPMFLVESMLKGGALGIWGDMFLSEQAQRDGDHWVFTFIGVPASLSRDLSKSVYDIATLDENAPINIFNRAKRYIPGQNLWYTRAALDNSIVHWIRNLLDPENEKKLARREKALKRDRGTEPLPAIKELRELVN